MARKLSDKRARFIEEYLKDRNATKAAIRAGYSKNGAKQTAHTIMKDPEVAAALGAVKAELHERALVDATYVITNLVEVVERCMQRAPVMIRAGKETVQLTDELGRNVWRFDSAGANNALNMLGKCVDLFGEKPKEPPEDRPLKEMSDTELKKKLQGDGE